MRAIDHQKSAHRADAFAHHLVVALVNLDMHAPTSAAVRGSAADLITELGKLATEDAPLEIEIGSEHLLSGRTPLLHASLQAKRLLRVCHERGIARIAFAKTTTAAELVRFLLLLGNPRERDAFRPEHVTGALAQHGIRSIRVATHPITERPAAPPPVDVAIRHYQSMADVLQANHVAAFKGDSLPFDQAAGVVEQAITAMDQEPSGLLTLAMSDDIDQFTVGHSVRVTLLALHVAQSLPIGRRDLMRIGTAALLHDIGKSRVPQEILFKPGRLDAEERRTMAMHARWGGELLLEHGGVDFAAIGAAFCHHMGPHGSGYPARAEPFEPSGISRLVRVCDVFEALTSVRPYKPAMPPLQAYVIMNRMKDGFDARWLEFFIRCVGLHPIGTQLVLDGGDEAIVVGRGTSLMTPQIEVLRDAAGNAPSPGAPTRFVVGQEREGKPVRIHSVLGAGTSVEIPPDVLPQDPPHIC